jgi:hypothetical protein
MESNKILLSDEILFVRKFFIILLFKLYAKSNV